ncbi:MAG: hypothetical protein WBQ75_16410 [Acetobacteraceae bacterium]
MSPHDIRRLVLAHELLASALTGDVSPPTHAKPETAETPRDRTPAIDDPRAADG